jgi:hypothetical protein
LAQSGLLHSPIDSDALSAFGTDERFNGREAGKMLSAPPCEHQALQVVPVAIAARTAAAFSAGTVQIAVPHSLQIVSA